jgi:hypothetical protein
MMDKFDDNEIGRLLRLKKYEQPPPGYFENFLHEFHRRQRDELLRQPLWKIAVGRAQDFMMINVARLASYLRGSDGGAALRGRDLAQNLSDPAKSERRPHCPYCSSPKRDRWWLESGFAGLHSHHRHSTTFASLDSPDGYASALCAGQHACEL